MSIVDDLIPHMRRVQGAERDLRDLSLLWQMIEASSAISCPEDAETILPMLTQTRVRFSALQARLVGQLGQESLAELRDEIASTAQCTIDILVRNLYERTADVGFLATDDVLRAFCTADGPARAAGQAALVNRLAEYRSKYTVYDDIAVLAPEGAVLARLDGSSTLQHSSDPVLAEARARHGYVERFARSDLATGSEPALLYAHRIDDDAGRCVGVLVLRFRNADEMLRIFASVSDAGRQVALLLLDENDRVIASNDEAHVPVGAPVRTAGDGEVALTTFGGREYLSVTRSTHGYQGYQGPRGWRAHAMVSLLTAFRGSHATEAEAAGGQALALDNEELARIQAEVDAINGDLRRVVFNGRLVAGAREGTQARLKAVLRQINEAGTRTRERVAAAIRDLHGSSIGRARHQALELARLAADIMDRNLYERANDCRWWALSPVLQRGLSEPAGAAGSAALNAVLAHINGLYTVYTRLVAFDAQGLIRAVSHDDEASPLLGTQVDATVQEAAARLGDTQRYWVTPFAASALSGGVPTYVYVAGVRQGTQPAGGIAIVFNAEREFRAMLDDVLAGRDGMAAFVDGEGRVVASTEAAFPVGSLLPFGETGVAEHGGAHHAVARVTAGGYREFKRSDGYSNGVHAVVALRLGGIDRRRSPLSDTALQPLPTRQPGSAREYALFHVGAGRYALPAAVVIEARRRDGLVRAPTRAPQVLGLLEVPDRSGTRVVPVLCARRLFGVEHQPRAGDGLVLVLGTPEAPGQPLVGLQVDDVASVLDVAAEHLQPAPDGLRSFTPRLAGLLRLGAREAGAGGMLVQLVDPTGLLAMASPPRALTPA